MKLLVTGGAGFIGSAVVRRAIADGHEVVNLDALTYAANLANLEAVAGSNRYAFEKADIRDRAALDRIFAAHRPDAVMHLAAESHVDRSIDGPAAFVDTNVAGTCTLLEAARAYWGGTPRVPLPPRLDRRGLWHAGPDRALHRGDALRPELALFRLQGRERPPGARLGRDLRAAGGDVELLQQLRAVPLPREADPGRDPERARRARDPGLRRGRERARLALCRGPRPGAARGGRAGADRRELQHRRRRGGDQPRHRAAHLRADGRDAPFGRAARPADRVRRRPARARLPLRDRRGQDPRRARLDPVGHARGGAAAHGRVVPGEPRHGGRRSRRAATSSSGAA